jgi:hypothetical protein
MNDLDERLVRTFSDHAPVYVRPMPRGTTARVRIRQALTSIVTVSVVATFAFAGVGLWSVMARSNQPASQETVPPPSGILPSPQGQQGALNDATAAPTEATADEDTMAHGTSSGIPYTMQVLGQEAYLLTAKHVVALGHVGGVEWTVAAYDTRAYSGQDFPRFLGGPCGDVMVGDQGEYGGIAFCLQTSDTAPDAQFAMAGFGNNLDPNVGPITAYVGLIGAEVASVELRSANGEVTPLALYDAPSGIGARYFEAFLDAGADGRIVALDADGTPIDSGALCVTRPPAGPDNVGCGDGLEDVFSVVTSVGEEPVAGWPRT